VMILKPNTSASLPSARGAPGYQDRRRRRLDHRHSKCPGPFY
jgi:hypothetical protein